MKALKFLVLGSLLVVVIQFLLGMYAITNDTYNAGYAQRMVPFIFIFIISTLVWLMMSVLKKIVKRRKTPE